MTMRIFGLGMAAVLLGGCATTAYQPRYSYYQVPCNTPGAVVATPVSLPGGAAVAPAPGAAVDPAHPAPGVAVVLPSAPVVATCVIAVSDRGYGYGSRYYDGFGRYGYGGFGSSYYSSFGFGYRSFGGHHHHSGGHHSGH